MNEGGRGSAARGAAGAWGAPLWTLELPLCRAACPWPVQCDGVVTGVIREMCVSVLCAFFECLFFKPELYAHLL